MTDMPESVYLYIGKDNDIEIMPFSVMKPIHKDWTLYTRANPATDHHPQIKIGNYILHDMPVVGFMIFHESGEGGQFSIEKFAEVVDKFYKENF